MFTQRLFQHFEELIQPTGPVVDQTPPAKLLPFFWHFARQARGVLLLLLGAGLVTAAMDVAIPVCIGRVAGLVSTHDRATLLQDEWPQFAAMAALVPRHSGYDLLAVLG